MLSSGSAGDRSAEANKKQCPVLRRTEAGGSAKVFGISKAGTSWAWALRPHLENGREDRVGVDSTPTPFPRLRIFSSLWRCPRHLYLLMSGFDLSAAPPVFSITDSLLQTRGSLLVPSSLFPTTSYPSPCSGRSASQLHLWVVHFSRPRPRPLLTWTSPCSSRCGPWSNISIAWELSKMQGLWPSPDQGLHFSISPRNPCDMRILQAWR